MRAIILLVACTGCSNILGLEPPSKHVDAAPVFDDAPVDPNCADIFGGSIIDPMWTHLGTPDVSTVEQGLLVIRPPASTSGLWGVQSRAISLPGSVEIQVVQRAVAPPSEYTMFRVEVDTQTRMSFLALNDKLEAITTIPGQSNSPVMNNWSDAYHYWRITLLPNKVTYDNRSDADVGWLPFASVDINPPLDVSSVHVSILAVHEGPGVTVPGEAHIDNFKLSNFGCP